MVIRGIYKDVNWVFKNNQDSLGILTFRGPCIVIYILITNTNEMHYFSHLFHMEYFLPFRSIC